MRQAQAVLTVLQRLLHDADAVEPGQYLGTCKFASLSLSRAAAAAWQMMVCPAGQFHGWTAAVAAAVAAPYLPKLLQVSVGLHIQQMLPYVCWDACGW